jgi:hypothetical protein
MLARFLTKFSRSSALMLSALGGMAALTLDGQTLYNFGNPTPEEQLHIELINRARANPSAEGARHAATTDPDVLSAYTQYGVNLSMMQTEFNAIAAQPPLAPNASLTTSARNHSLWMYATATQAHNETNPSNTPWDRMVAAGYNYNSAGENIYAYAKSVGFCHAGFEVDWGTGGTGGMQAGRGHRANIHSSSFREIGVGVKLGSNGAVGPQLVTQDFGYRSSSPSFGTGVAYYDINGNNFYDIGEGISGVTVNVSGASYYCTTAIGGGWAVPVPNSATTRTVTFSGLGLNQSTNLVCPASNNAKADLKLSYSAPAITSAASAYSGSPYTLAFNNVGGATGYRWKRWTMAAAAAENCESTANITSSTTGSYSVRSTTVKQQGTSSFHLMNSTGASQSIELNSLFYGQASPSLSFQSRILYATTSESFKVQIKEDGGASVWQDVFSQAGTNTSGESSFNLRSAALTAMTGKAFRVRFLLNHTGSYYTSANDSMGWFIDAISFSNVSTLTNPASQLLASNSGSFTPDPGSYLMSVAPVISGLDFPASYQVLSVSTQASQTITFSPPGTKTYGDAPFTLGATASSGLPVTYASSNPAVATVSGNTVTLVSPGSTTITASQAGNASYTAAPDVMQTLTVSDPPPPPSPTFATWASAFESANSLPPGTISNPNGDYDRDGRSNLIEYAFGGSPVIANDPAPGLPAAHTTDTDFVLQYQRDTSLSDLTFTVQACPVMQYWKAPGEAGAPAGFTDEVISTNGIIETHEAKIPLGSGNCFMRVQVSRQ